MMPLQNGQPTFWKAFWNDNIFRKVVIPSQWLSASTGYLFTMRERKSGSRVAGVSGRRTVEMYGGWVSWSSNWSLEMPSTKLTYPTLGKWTSIFKSVLGWEWMGYVSYEEGTFPLIMHLPLELGFKETLLSYRIFSCEKGSKKNRENMFVLSLNREGLMTNDQYTRLPNLTFSHCKIQWFPRWFCLPFGAGNACDFAVAFAGECPKGKFSEVAWLKFEHRSPVAHRLWVVTWWTWTIVVNLQHAGPRKVW